MTDREKVTEILEKAKTIIENWVPMFEQYNTPAGIDDAIVLLKEQEARILGWDEIKNYSVVYGEFKGISEIYPLIITYDSKGRALSWNPCINRKEEYLLLTYDEEDRKNTRCWNKMPTEEQRQAVKWND